MIRPLHSKTLRPLAFLLCGEGRSYRTGPALRQFFRDAGLPDPPEIEDTRFAWTLARLRAYNQDPAQMEAVLLQLAHPAEYPERADVLDATLETLNALLAPEGLAVTVVGAIPHLTPLDAAATPAHPDLATLVGAIPTLAARAEALQATPPGAAPALAALVRVYQDWYTDALAALPADLHAAFRTEYEGRALVAPKIRQYLEGATTPNPLYTEASAAAGLSPWTYPYARTFHGPLLAQRAILLEAQKRPASATPPLDAVAQVVQLARRFPRVVRQLRQRHAGRAPLVITDEYDLQDLFHALLTVYFDDIRAEEGTTSFAGGSARLDFLLKADQVAIELKMTRPGLTAKALGDQLLVDLGRYPAAHPDCRALVIVVYDPSRTIANPAGLEQDLSRVRGALPVTVIVAQE